MRLYITGGGTGGHVTPGLAIARYFEKRQPDTVIRFAGSARGIENKLVPREGYPLDAIEIIGLSRSMSPKGIMHNLKAAKLAVSAVAKAKKMLREARPITDAKRFIQQHYQEALRLEDVSSAVGFNATYFSAMFKKETGQNFMDYLTELRMNKAKELLCTDENSVQDVADQIGYRDLKYFSRLFKKTTGISPSEYKKLYR